MNIFHCLSQSLRFSLCVYVVALLLWCTMLSGCRPEFPPTPTIVPLLTPFRTVAADATLPEPVSPPSQPTPSQPPSQSPLLDSLLIDGVVPATEFTLASLDGTTVHLSDLRGQYVLVNFWATWCLPCRDEMPYLQELATDHGADLTVLGINMRETATEIQPFIDEVGVTFPILLQPDDATLLSYGIRGLPLTVLVDPRGQLVYRRIGPLEPDVFDPLFASLLQ